MPAIHCSYTRVSLEPTPARPQGHVVWRPWLVATVAVAGSDPLPCTVCLDTGADNCVFPLSLARRLGLNLLAMPMTTDDGRRFERDGLPRPRAGCDPVPSS